MEVQIGVRTGGCRLHLPGVEGFDGGGAQLTPRRLSPSSLWRGITVTISISQMKATSGGVSPGGSGSAIVSCVMEVCIKG